MIFLERVREGYHQSALEPFQRQRWENFWETGWSAYGLFQVHRYHLELSWTELNWTDWDFGFKGDTKWVSKLVFYAQSTGTVISGRWHKVRSRLHMVILSIFIQVLFLGLSLSWSESWVCSLPEKGWLVTLLIFLPHIVDNSATHQPCL